MKLKTKIKDIICRFTCCNSNMTDDSESNLEDRLCPKGFRFDERGKMYNIYSNMIYSLSSEESN